MTPNNGGTVQGQTQLRCDPGIAASCVSAVVYYIQPPGGGITELDRSSAAPYAITWNTTNGAYPNGSYGLSCQTINTSQNASTAAVISVTVNNQLVTESQQKDERRGLDWTSELALNGGKGQIVWDGAEAEYVEEHGTGTFRVDGPGNHRIEATVVDAAGHPGTWTFRFDRTFKPGSLQPVAGALLRVTGDSITFRLTGKPGERAVFKLETQ